MNSKCQECKGKFHMLLARMTELPEPEKIVVFPSRALRNLYQEARIARDRYMASLGEACVEHDDGLPDKNLSSFARTGDNVESVLRNRHQA